MLSAISNIILDIETLPCEEDKKEKFIKVLLARGNKSSGTKIKYEDLTPKQLAKLHHDTGLEGTFGQVFCIGYIKEEPYSGTIQDKNVLQGTEKEILEQFWNVVTNCRLFIGHNIMEFDLPFIYKRSIIHSIKPTKDLSFAKYRNDPIFDTQKEWEKWAYGKAQKLDTLAKAFNLPTSKGDLDGSKVYDAWLDGEYEKIYEYCMKDVELTRKIYHKMIFKQVAE